MAITVAPLTTTVMNAVGPELAGTASGINNAVSRVAALLAIAVLGIVMATVFDARLASELNAAQAPPDVAQALLAQRQKLAGITLPEGLPEPVAARLHEAVGASFVAGFRWVMAICVALSLLSALSAWGFIRAQQDR
jgi:hypothetical protein